MRRLDSPVVALAVLVLALGTGLGLGRFGLVPAALASTPGSHADATIDDGAVPAPEDAQSAADPKWNYPVVVNDDGSGAWQSDPALVADPGGGLHAAWVDRRLGGDGDALYYARWPEGAGAWEPNQRVTGGDAARRAAPALAIDALGAVHLVWAESRGGAPDILHSVRPVGSRVWSPPERVNDELGETVQWSPAIAADLYGSVHVIWEDSRAGDADIYYARRLGDGTWSANSRVNNPVAGDQRAPALAALRSGDLFAVWEDTRHQRGDIFVSRLPPGGDVWWPNGRLSQGAEHGLSRSPAIAGDSSGRAYALWIDEGEGAGGGLRAATLLDPGRFWEPDRLVYRAERGTLSSAALAGGPGGRVLAAWGETRPDGSRLYSGLLAPDAPLTASRVDASPLVGSSERPVAAIDRLSRAHLVWQADDRAGQLDILHAQAELVPPTYSPATASGWLQYRVRQPNCGSDGFVTVLCDGSPHERVMTRGLDLVPFLGSYVSLGGYRVEDTACGYIVATSVNFGPPPCPRQKSAITGVLIDLGRPVEGAVVHLGDLAVTTGSSGRFYFDGLEPGATVTLTATLACALTARIGPFRAGGGLNVLPPGRFLRGDVTGDCVIDVFDLAATAAQFQGPSPFFPSCSDVDGDGTVGFADLAIISANYDATCPAPWQAPQGAAASAEQGPGEILR